MLSETIIHLTSPDVRCFYPSWYSNPSLSKILGLTASIQAVLDISAERDNNEKHIGPNVMKLETISSLAREFGPACQKTTCFLRLIGMPSWRYALSREAGTSTGNVSRIQRSM
jgi:hypothetical protein